MQRKTAIERDRVGNNTERGGERGRERERESTEKREGETETVR